MKPKSGTNMIPEIQLTSTVSKNAQKRPSKKRISKRKTTEITANIHSKDTFDVLVSERQPPSEEPGTKFSATVPKKRWQKFDQVSDKALHVVEGIQETEQLPSEHCDVLVGDTNKSCPFVPGKETTINVSENTQGNCQKIDIPTGKVSM